MPKSNDAEEVRVLRFFEEEPIEKAELLFNIVSVKMRERLQEQTKPREEKATAKPRENRKRQTRQSDDNARKDPQGDPRPGTHQVTDAS